MLGVVWTACWLLWFQDTPGDDQTRADGDIPKAAVHRAPVPWGALLSSRNVQAICLMYFAYGYGLYFYFTWLPTYLTNVLRLSATRGWIFSALPFLLAGIANLAGGWTTDRLAQTRGLYVARSGLGCAGFLVCAALVCAAAIVPQPTAKALLLALALGAVDFALGACWAVCLDIGPGHAGVVTGTMNTVGNIGGVLMPIVAGFIVERWESWTLVFYVTAAVYVCGAAAWLTIDPLTPITAGATPGLKPRPTDDVRRG
jgi:nitrate/nitrite transporter NarK